jgi:N6-adenosine-specific RNA methylase IME4
MMTYEEMEGLEEGVVRYLIENVEVLIPHLPLPLHLLLDMLAVANIRASLVELEDAMRMINGLLPSGIVLDYAQPAGSMGLSGVALAMYDVVVLKQWMRAVNGESIYNEEEGNKADCDEASSSEKPDVFLSLFKLIETNSTALGERQKELRELVDGSTSKQRLLLEQALLAPEKPYVQICHHPSRSECLIQGRLDCLRKIHFEPIITSTTDVSIGDCSYLDTCYKGKGCKYVHYKIVYPDQPVEPPKTNENQADKCIKSYFTLGERMTGTQYSELPAQWISCDIRKLDLSVLGQFAAIIADPPWDIHMNGHLQLPYGVVTDDEILSFKIEDIQTEGVFFLWVTGRALDIGRKCLKKWGYTHIEEIIWCKTNQLGRTICTGRTGHWLNHSKEHVLMGIKGSPEWLASNLDIDTIVSATRDKSHKPDELYDIAERLVGLTSRKLELFGREHNARNRWMTVGNQLDGTRIIEPDVAQRFHNWRIKNGA